MAQSAMNEYPVSRRFRRVTVDLPVVVRTGDGRLADEAADLSETGMRLCTDAPLPVGAHCAFILSLPNHYGTEFEVLGQVVWSCSNSMGIAFEHLDERLVSYVERLRRHEESL